MLKDSPARSVLLISIPVIILNILKAGYNIVDMFWLGQLGKEYLAGVSASIFLVWAMHGFSTLVTVGIVAGISRNIGEGKLNTARSNTWRSLKLAFGLGLFFTFFLFPLIDPLVGVIQLEPVAYKAGVQYLQIMILATVLTFLMFSLHSVLIAWGDTKTPVIVYAVTFVFNILLSPVLMFGLGPFPRLETRGAAIATVVSYFMGAAFFFAVILKKKWILFKPVGEEIRFRRYISVGYPVALSSMVFSFIYFFLAKITAVFGSSAIGAMGVGHKVESLAYFFSQGIASGLSTFTGRNLGAGSEERTRAGAMAGIKYAGIATAAYSLMTIIFAPEIVSIFNNDPELVRNGVQYLRIVMPAEALQSILIVMENGAFSGSSYTKPSFSISLPIGFLRIPLAWFLAVFLGLEADGIWLTISLTMALNSFIFMILFKQSHWLKAKI